MLIILFVIRGDKHNPFHRLAISSANRDTRLSLVLTSFHKQYVPWETSVTSYAGSFALRFVLLYVMNRKRGWLRFLSEECDFVRWWKEYCLGTEVILYSWNMMRTITIKNMKTRSIHSIRGRADWSSWRIDYWKESNDYHSHLCSGTLSSSETHAMKGK